MRMKYLIVNADDYGRTAAVSGGIRDAHLNGIVTSTTAMMNLPGVVDALGEADLLCPDLGLGVHLVLTAGAPLLPPAQVPSLVDAQGKFLALSEFQTRAATIAAMQAHAEWRAQIEKFVDTLGREPDHLDSHHHTSYFTPALFETMLELATEYHCAIRLPWSVDAAPAEDAPTRAVRQLLQASAVAHPARLATSFYDQGATRENLREIMQSLNDGITEVMCHPGYVDAELASSSYNVQREREVGILTNLDVKARVKELGIELVTSRVFRGSLPRAR